jgi:hypothetical protein
MSRYTIPANSDQYEIVVGYDPALKSFFAALWDYEECDPDEDRPTRWIGYEPRQVTSVDDLAAWLAGYATLGPRWRSLLEGDQARMSPPGPPDRDHRD